jgi:glutaminyl-tRNA synthetase
MIENENGETAFNENSVRECEAYGEESIKNSKPEDRFQFFRHGYYIADAYETKGDVKVFNQNYLLNYNTSSVSAIFSKSSLSLRFD